MDVASQALCCAVHPFYSQFTHSKVIADANNPKSDSGVEIVASAVEDLTAADVALHCPSFVEA